MFRFFKEVRKRLLSENRFSKYVLYAIGEIFLVVVGILIALAANNWNQQQSDIKAEIKLLQQLQKEFVENLDELAQNIQLRSEMNLSAYTLRGYFKDGADGVAISALEKHRALTYYNVNFNAPSGTVSLLLNSGELNLIRDEELKIRLSNWSGTLEEMTQEESFITTHLLPQYFHYTNLNFDAIKLAGVYDQMRNDAFTDPLQGRAERNVDPANSGLYDKEGKGLEEWTRWLSDKTIINYVLQIATRNKIANAKAEEVKLENERILELIQQNLEGHD